VSILFPLELKYPDRFKAFYYHTPKLHGVLKAILPERYNELVGVQHTKCYMIDDDVLISGANLSEQYFTNRQDRYVWIRNNSALASFYQNLLETICSFSFAIHSSNGQLVYPNTVPNPTVDPKSFNEIARDKLEALLQPRIEISASSSTGLPETLDGSSLLKTHDTWVFPTLQLGHANVTHDEALTEFILAHQPTVDQSQGYTTYMTSPYFNIADRYATAMMKCHGKPFRLIVASPKANGFFNGSGVSGMVPWAYDTVLKDWILALPRDSNIHVHEYVREGWTFHAKGLWIEMNQDGQPPDQSSSATSSSSSSTASDASIASSSSRVSSSTSPSSSEQTRTIGRPTASFTLVGSSNFGVRSMKRDLETQLAIFTTNEDLSRRLREEREYIFQGAQEVTPQTFEQRADNHSSMLRFVIPFATKYM
jgi:CDP-diacylglycerol--glycerol-3-phosphate 3-phosphatidyltransferase